MNLLGKIVIVHGQKLGDEGELKDGFVKRLDKSVEVLVENKCDFILVSGGRTRERFPSEAEVGADYLRKKYFIEVVEERQSLTTVDNVVCASKLIGQNPEFIYAISSRSKLPRLRFLYEKLYPEIYDKIDFVSSGEDSPIIEPLKEFLHLAYNRFDLHEESSAVRFLRKTLRNGH